MSGWVALWNLDGAPVAPEDFAPILDAIRHRGPDGSDLIHRGAVTLGHQHFWTTPEEWGERQPLVDETAGLALVWDGRLDNRDELVAALGLASAEVTSFSDATLVLRAYDRWQGDCFTRLRGPFAVLVFDLRRRRLLAARDPLGQRTLFYHHAARFLLVASEEEAVLAHPAVPWTVNEQSVVQFFAIRPPLPGQTFFAAVHELLPGHTLSSDGTRISVSRFQTVDVSQRIRYRNDAEYAEHFFHFLEQSVRVCLRAPDTPAAMLSGGLDSSSVAALAVEMLAARGERLRTFSWVFDEVWESDERRLIQAFLRQHPVDAVFINGDRDWPLRDIASWPTPRATPLQNAFRRLKDHLFSQVREHGHRILLSGAYGDEFYLGVARYWLADLLAEGRLWRAGAELIAEIRYQYGMRLHQIPVVRYLGRRILDRLPFGLNRLYPPPGATIPEWLTDHARRLLVADPEPPECRLARRPEQCDGVLGTWASLGGAGEVPWASHWRLEVRYPYRDQRLLEFMLAVPAHQLYRVSRYKAIVRRAMQGKLPEEQRQQRIRIVLTALYKRGMVERERATLASLLDGPDAAWRNYVREEWVARCLENSVQQAGRAAALLPWHCATFELWRRRCDDWHPAESPT